MLKDYALVFATSMVPVAELRASIPMGVAMDLPLFMVWAVSVIGNMIPVPFIILFVRRILEWMKTREGRLSRFAEFLEEKAEKGANAFYKYEMLGLFIFVAIPLPGTGAWTGALAASLLNLRLRNSLPMLFLGVVVAGLIMLAISVGVLAGVSAGIDAVTK